jgi:folylpolyglutamate synthase/dihydropteroate synthase
LLPALLKTLSKSKFRFKSVVFTSNEPWKNPAEHLGGDLVNNTVVNDTTLPTQNELATHFKSIAGDLNVEYENIAVVPNVETAVDLVKDSNRVLVTGSLHLVGSCLTVLEVPVS